MSLGFIWSAEYTIISHSEIFNNLVGVWILLFSILKREHVFKAEIIGTTVSLLGCLVSISDSNAKKANPDTQNIYLGDLIGFFGSMFGAIFIKNIEVTNGYFPPICSITAIFTSCGLSLAFIPPLFNIRVSNYGFISLNTDPKIGILGFITSEDYLYILFAGGFLAGALTFTPFGYIVKLYSPLVLCNLVLCYPFFGQIIGC